MDVGDWASLVGTATIVIGVPIGLWQYRGAQAWKRAEFAAAQMRAFFGDARVKSALTMLDYNVRRIELFPGEEGAPGRAVVVDDDLLKEALRPHLTASDLESQARQGERGGAGAFTKTQAVIRDVFDHFFDELERFDHFIEAGLVRKQDFQPYLAYWIATIGNRDKGRKAPDVIEQIWRYVATYRYHGVQRLFARYGFDIRPPPQETPGPKPIPAP